MKFGLPWLRCLASCAVHRGGAPSLACAPAALPMLLEGLAILERV